MAAGGGEDAEAGALRFSAAVAERGKSSRSFVLLSLRTNLSCVGTGAGSSRTGAGGARTGAGEGAADLSPGSDSRTDLTFFLAIILKREFDAPSGVDFAVFLAVAGGGDGALGAC